MMLTDALPEGVYRDPETHQLMRIRLRFRGFENEAGQPWQAGDGPRYEEHDKVPHPCGVAFAGESPDEIDRKWNEAVRNEQDFHHPRLGWLAFGRKREQEWPQNEGAGVVRYERRRRLAPVVDATGVPAAAVVENPEPDPAPRPDPEPAPPDPTFDPSVPPAESRRRRVD